MKRMKKKPSKHSELSPPLVYPVFSKVWPLLTYSMVGFDIMLLSIVNLLLTVQYLFVLINVRIYFTLVF